MEIKPLAFESIGVRSQATLIETKDLRIVIDPAISLAPIRYGLPPHEIEVKRLIELAEVITKEASSADVLIITHYHYDHHDPGFIIPTDVYKEKIVIIKDPLNNINNSQRYRRAPRFLKSIKNIPKIIEIADGKEYRIGSTIISFSNAVPHGADERLGYVVQVAIKDGDSCVLFTSDIEGAVRPQHTEFTFKMKPNFIIIDGPLSYLLGRVLSQKDLETSIRNLEMIAKSGVERIIIDHHVLRDLNYREVLRPIYELSRDVGIRILTAAEYLGREIEQLEAKRRELYSKDPKPAKIPRNLARLFRASQEGS
ncbi:MAG: hypothetical protein QXV69_05370 [Sulfolobaceae archaeon]